MKNYPIVGFTSKNLTLTCSFTKAMHVLNKHKVTLSLLLNFTHFLGPKHTQIESENKQSDKGVRD